MGAMGVMGPVHVVLPGDVDDAAAVSGGNTYDRRVCHALPGTGWAVRELPVAGAWPAPDETARAALAGTLAAVPDGGVVLADGLVACAAPDTVGAHARRLRIAVLVHLPLGDETGPGPRRAAELAAGERAALHAADAVVTTSSWAARRLVAWHGLDGERVHVATPGVDPAPFAPGTDGATRLLCVGSLTPTKGQDLLVAALATARMLPWQCDLAGPLHRDPAHVAAVRCAVERHGLGTRIRLTGPLDEAELAAAYAAADLLVLPSRAESYGMVLTEALARGIPVVAAAVGGVPETLGGAPDAPPGLLVAPASVPALATALLRWLGDPALRDTVRHRARQRRGCLDSWEVTARCLATVLDRLRGTPG